MMTKKQSSILTIAIIGLFVVVWLFRVFLVLSHDAKLRGNISMMRSHVYALKLFRENNENNYPDISAWPEILFDHGLIEQSMFEYADIDGDQFAYEYLPNFESEREDWILLYEDPDHWEEGVIVGYVSTEVELLGHEEFERMLAEQLNGTPETP